MRAFGKEYLPKGAVVDGEIRDYDVFLMALKSVLESEKNNFPKTKYLVVSLPEEKSFLRVIELPIALKGEELKNALKFEIEANIPMAPSEVYYDYEIVNTDAASGHYDILINAAPRKIVDNYSDFFSKTGYRTLALELESLAAQRSLFSGQERKESVLILDIGSAITRFMIVSEGMLRFTSSNSVSGNKFSQMLTERFPLDLKEAEFMKRVAGLDKNHEKGREMLEALRPGLISLADQIKNYINFFETHPASHTLPENAQKISKVMVTGGGAALWGLADWLGQEIGIGVITANPLVKIKFDSGSNNPMSLEESLSYTTAVGLALRTFEEMP